jgi:hypothetical protein
LPPAESQSVRIAFGLLVIEPLDIGLLFGEALEVPRVAFSNESQTDLVITDEDRHTFGPSRSFL